MAAGIRTEGGDTFGLPKPESKVRNPAGPAGLATAVVNSGNSKTGPTLATYASQASCPDGGNNNAGFKCPLYNAGCYAESGQTGFTTSRLNKVGKVDRKSATAEATPEEVAVDEAAALMAVKKEWREKRKNPYVRLHVVGDCVTVKAARTLSDVAEQFAESLPGGVKNVWNYTHGWRDVPRSTWSSRISVLASVDSEEDLEAAHNRGYACAMVVPTYVQVEGKKEGVSYHLSNGFKVIPCPFEVGRSVQCITCRLCLKDDWLRQNKAVIAFAAHGSKANQISKRLIDIKPGKE